MEGRNGHGTNGRPPSPPNANGGAGGDHGTNGRFTRGNRAGLGSRFKANNKAAAGHNCPFLRDQARIRSALFHFFRDEHMEMIVNKLVGMFVEDGNFTALDYLFQYTVGPRMAFNVSPDDADRDELERMRAQGQIDAMGNNRLPPAVALVIEKVYADLAAAEAVAQDLDDGGTGLGRRLLAALQDAGLHDLARAAKAYRDNLAAGDRHEP
jgi:hypothetical protein